MLTMEGLKVGSLVYFGSLSNVIGEADFYWVGICTDVSDACFGVYILYGTAYRYDGKQSFDSKDFPYKNLRILC